MFRPPESSRTKRRIKQEGATLLGHCSFKRNGSRNYSGCVIHNGTLLVEHPLEGWVKPAL